ncbi:MAG TPA: dioxygenase [Casimicrobiaceae bacterium]|nr:dioxygenase [Casimicrobiaceae bacterium]
MVIRNEQDVTDAVLRELARAPDARFREIMTAAVRHLHAFVRDAKLTESELQQVCGVIASLGKATTESHNEVVLAAGSLGVSALVCLLNNGEGGTRTTTANLLGPFWRMDSPRTENGGSIVRSPTPGEPIFVTARVTDASGKPVPGAEVDVWHSSPEGLYENQDARQAEMNLRGKFVTDADGAISFRSIKPAGYPIPVTGPVGALLRAQGRHNMRPAHLHFLIFKSGYKTQYSQVYSSGDPYLETDAQFGVTEALVARYVEHRGERVPYGDAAAVWHSLDYTFVIEPGIAKLPRPPITEKARVS